MPIQTIATDKRVKLAENVDHYPTGVFEAGLTGIVTGYDPINDCYFVRLDNHRAELDEWDNVLQIFGDEGEWPAARYLTPTSTLRRDDGSLDAYVRRFCEDRGIECDGDLWGIVFSGVRDEISESDARDQMLQNVGVRA